MFDTLIKLYGGSLVELTHAPTPPQPHLQLLDAETGLIRLALEPAPPGMALGVMEHRTGGEEGDAEFDHGDLTVTNPESVINGAFQTTLGPASYQFSTYFFRADGLRSQPSPKSVSITIPAPE